MKSRTSSRLAQIQDRKNSQQAILFILLSIAFIGLLIFLGVPLFIKLATLVGDVKSSSQAIDNKDTIAPAAPRIYTDFEATPSAKISLKGNAEPASTVVLYKNNEEDQEVVTGTDGQFNFENVYLSQGENEFHAVATDPSGNESKPSTKALIISDSKAPSLEILIPKDGQAFYYEEREIVVGGKTDDEKVSVKVNGNIVVVDNEGNFAKKIKLNEGTNSIEIIASDEAGNKTVKKIEVSYSN
ncbi:cadherin-like beta sandwich domain-containing protein [Candidatus Beckwithbacteria bacterium]|nr:cadherin-like beta sandwich domain-containing protein [Candidatus Beckwithbacteria bacterium]